MGLLRQTWTLITKDLRIIAQRRWFSTFLRAVALPVAYMFFIAYVRNFFLPPSEYGIGSPRAVRDLTTEVFGSDVSLGGRDRVVFINNGFTGGQIEQLIDGLAAPLADAGADVQILSSDDQLLEVCRSNLRGLSRCYGAVTFHSSPTEGSGNVWSYTARSDWGLGFSVYVDRPTNDAQVYVLPFIQAIDAEIARLGGAALPDVMLEYPFTHETAQDREDEIQSAYMGALARYLGVTLFIGICGVAYHLPGHMATEREHGISALIDAMIPSNGPWKSIVARLSSAYISFVAVYLAGWIAIGVIVSTLIYYNTATSIVVLFHILTGLSLTAYSVLGASFFRKAQLSGITVLLVALVLAVLSQFIPRNTTTVTALSVIFPSITYTSFIIYLSEWEETLTAANLVERSPGSSIAIPGYLYFVFLAIQIAVFPLISVFLQRLLYSSSQGSRRFVPSSSGTSAFRIVDVSKHYFPGRFRELFSRVGFFQRDVFKAVDRISLSALQGSILTLLGSNGSGKSTTLSMMAGTTSTTHGYIEIEKGTSLGVCPQHNVLWGDLTVFEHVKIFNGLKAVGKTDTRAALKDLVSACDLEQKISAKSKILSGGQKRKLQLAMAFTAGSKLCCIDEVSSGLDPLSRRIIWQILLAERGRRTILMTTHALDEADALSDQIAIMSKGKIIAEGSAVELKHRYGGGYKMTVEEQAKAQVPFTKSMSTVKGNARVYRVQGSSEATELVTSLQKQGRTKFDISGPTIEDVFLATSGEYKEEHKSSVHINSDCDTPDSYMFDNDKPAYGLVQGRGTGFVAQVWILFRKRLLILTRNYLPYIFAIVIPVLTAGLATMFLGGFNRLICSPSQLANNPRTATLPILDWYWGIEIPAGPSSRFSPSQLPAAYRLYADRLRPVDDFDQFQAYTRNNFRDVMPGGIYLGDNSTAAPLLSYRVDGGLSYAALAKNLIDSVVLNTTILAEFSTFALPIAGSTGDSLQLVLYFGFAMCAYPAFFALYPTFERVGNIRALHYSNGVRPAALWLAYALYDTIFVMLISVLAIVILTSLADVWYAPGYFFVVLLLYGISSTLLSYIISLFTTTQLATFAFAAGGQAVFMLIYFIMYMVLLTFSQADRLYTDLNTVQFSYGLITPSGNLLRALLLTLNQSQLICRTQEYVSYPGEITVYGGPILYLVIQIIVFYAFLISFDNGWLPKIPIGWLYRQRSSGRDPEKSMDTLDEAVAAEAARVENSGDALRVLHLTKRYGANTAVEDVTFGVPHDDILALLGPNGAGKTTTIDVIRGKARPSSPESSVMIEDIPVLKSRIQAGRLLGVCPQFDTMDRMTVAEHLSFYARARGVPDIARNVNQVIVAVGLTPFKNRMAAKLSGGNQRKLSLGTAIIGNPSVLLLDEPSSGMDAVAKRVMWKVIHGISKGRSIVLTTHSMEEASALADRAAIMARRILAIGDIKSLARTHGEGVYHVHLFLKDADAISEERVRKLREWIGATFGNPRISGALLHGQIKFVVPIQNTATAADQSSAGNKTAFETITPASQTTTQTPTKSIPSSPPTPFPSSSPSTSPSSTSTSDLPPNLHKSEMQGILRILHLLESNKDALGIEYYSVSESTLEDVFLKIVGKERGRTWEEE